MIKYVIISSKIHKVLLVPCLFRNSCTLGGWVAGTWKDCSGKLAKEVITKTCACAFNFTLFDTIKEAELQLFLDSL